MGPGIFTKYSKPVLGGLTAFLVLLLAVGLYFRFRSPVGGPSPYEEVNGWDGETVEVEADEVFYAQQTGPLQVTVRNLSETTYRIVPAPYRPLEWVLEFRVDGQWRSMRTEQQHIRWDFPAEDKTPNSGPSGIVKPGEEQRFLCYIAKDYGIPLKPGVYRVVFPDMEVPMGDYGTKLTHLAAEFEVIP